MKTQLYNKVEQEHDLFQNDEIYMSPQQKYISENIIHKAFKLGNFEIEKTPDFRYSIIYAILSHCEKYKIPLPKQVEDQKTMKTKINAVIQLLVEYWEKILKSDKEAQHVDLQQVKETQQRIHKIKNPKKGIGIDTSDIFILARILKIRIYVYYEDKRKWEENVPRTSRFITGGGIYYYKEQVNGNIFLYCRSNGTFDGIYPKIATQKTITLVKPSLKKGESKLKKVTILKKTAPTKKPTTIAELKKINLKTMKESKKMKEKVKKAQEKKLKEAKKEQEKAKKAQEKKLKEAKKEQQKAKKAQEKKLKEAKKEEEKAKKAQEKKLKEAKKEQEKAKKAHEKPKRCPKGTRRNKVSGDCEPVQMIKDVKQKLKRCPKGTRRNKKTGQCEPVKI
jgi:chemotaxis protein histidine kinase CheA